MNPEFLKVLMNTVVVKLPTQKLASFGTSVVTYNMVTRPLYQTLDADKRTEEAVLRRGTVKAERPQIVTPRFLSLLLAHSLAYALSRVANSENAITS